jgi:signal transduction histidine kinase
MASSITIFWIEVTDEEAQVLERVARGHHASLVAVQMYGLPSIVFAARAQGAVVFVARTAEEATRALGLGADEVIRAGEISEEALTLTLARASARGEARTSYELRRGLFQDDDDLALAALVSAFGRRLADPIATASVGCELLESTLGTILDVDDKFVEWVVRSGVGGEALDLAIRRLAHPSAREVLRVLADVRKELRGAGSLAMSLAELAAHAERSGAGSIAALARDVVGVMRDDYSAWAIFTVEVEGPCKVAIAPVSVAFVLAALIVNAVDAIRGGRKGTGRVEIRLSEHEDAVLLEVQDDGRPVRTDLRPSVLEPYFGVARSDRTGLVRIRERMRRCGGDVQVDSGEGGTTVRVLLPTSTEEVVFDPAVLETAPALKKDRQN